MTVMTKIEETTTLQVYAAELPNNYGFNLSLVKVDSQNEIVTGFTLNNLDTMEQAVKLSEELANWLGTKLYNPMLETIN